MKSAVDIFHDKIIELLGQSVNSNTVAKIWIECKEVEKQQIIEAYKEGQLSIIQVLIDKFRFRLPDSITKDNEDAVEYYKQTYGSA